MDFSENGRDMHGEKGKNMGAERKSHLGIFFPRNKKERFRYEEQQSDQCASGSGSHGQV